MNTPAKQQAEVPYGTLDLLILKTLDAMGKMHGYAIARRIEQVAGDSLRLSQGSVNPPSSDSSRKAGLPRNGGFRKPIAR